MSMELYEAIFDEESVDGVFAISLVENPATKEMFIQLSEDEKDAIKTIKLATINEDQRLLVGLVLEPNSPVYRNQDGEEFNIIFSEDTITKLAHNFFIGDYHKNSSIEHDNKKITGVTFVESWLVADPKKDKSNVYDLEYPAGSWLVAMKVDSDEIWNDYVKTGKVKGFSIDAMVKLKKVDNKSKISMSTIVEKLQKATNELAIALKLKATPEEKPEVDTGEKSEEVEIKLGQMMMDGGEIIFEYEGEILEPGINIFAIDKTDETVRIPVPEGKYPLEDGSTLVVTQEGIVGEIIPKEGEAPEKKPEDVKVDEPVAANDEKSVVNDIKSILIKYEERFTAIEAVLKDMKTEVVELAEQPVVKPKTAMAIVELNKNGRILEKLRDNKN